MVAGPKDVALQVTGLEDSISVAAEGKNENDEERKIMAKVGHDKVEEHMEKVKNRIDDEKNQGGWDEDATNLSGPEVRRNPGYS